MAAWVAFLGEERTDEQLAAIRADTVKEFDGMITSFTCDECPAKRTCEFAFDAYNTGGDCLAEK